MVSKSYILGYSITTFLFHLLCHSAVYSAFFKITFFSQVNIMQTSIKLITWTPVPVCLPWTRDFLNSKHFYFAFDFLYLLLMQRKQNISYVSHTTTRLFVKSWMKFSSVNIWSLVFGKFSKARYFN